jgi:rfaE bifunctional protein nucleotidyltransferase chain/domain
MQQPNLRTVTALDDLAQLRQLWRDQGMKIVFTNGIFDLLHIGHLQYLEAARGLGDLLIVGLNSDSSARQIKGPKRPLIPQAERAALLLGLRPVDYVTIFDDLTAERLVAALQPDLYVKGGDYTLSEPASSGTSSGSQPPKALPEARIVQSYGGHIELINYLAGHSTTELIERIVERYASNNDLR